MTDLLLTALENPIKCVEDNTEQKVNIPVRLGFQMKRSNLLAGRLFELMIAREEGKMVH